MNIDFKFCFLGDMRMNVFELMPNLIKAALESDRKMIESTAIMISKKIRNEYPEVSKSIIKALSIEGAPVTRSLNSQVPVDHESRYELANIKEPDDIPIPILNTHTLKKLNDFIIERNSVNELLDQDILPPNSILMFGAPGVGKTYIANWLSSQLKLPLITLDLASSISSYLGRTGQNIHNIFEFARSQNAILFLDELDAIAKRRDDAGDLGELKRLVNVLLKELEECSFSCIVIGATNHPELLDAAIWRRFDRTIEISMPTDVERKALIKRHLNKFLKTISAETIEYLIKYTDSVNAADVCKLCEHIKRHVVLNKDVDINLIVLEEVFALNPPKSKDVKIAICYELHNKFPQLAQRDISQITQIPLSSVSRYLTKK